MADADTIGFFHRVGVHVFGNTNARCTSRMCCNYWLYLYYIVFLHLGSLRPKLFFFLGGQRQTCRTLRCEVCTEFVFQQNQAKPWEFQRGCTNLVNANGTIIASSAMASGFGHSIDHTAPLGAHETWYQKENRSWKRSDVMKDFKSIQVS